MNEREGYSKNMTLLSNHQLIFNINNAMDMIRLLLNFSLADKEDFGSTCDTSHVIDFSIPKDIEFNPLLKEIFEALSFMPSILIIIIDDYINPDKTIYEYSNRITKKLREIIKGTITLDLYDSNFMSNLLELTRYIEEKIPINAPLWHDLERFLFKYALSMRKRFADNENLFEK